MTTAWGNPGYFYVQLLAAAFIGTALLFYKDARLFRYLAPVAAVGAAAYFAYAGIIQPVATPAYDFASYYVAARDLAGGGDPYAHFDLLMRGQGPYPEALRTLGIPRIPPITYPPLLYAAIIPITAVSFLTAWKIWVFVNAALLAATAFLALRAAGLKGPWAAMTALAFTAIAHPVISNAAEGQANLVIAALVAAGAWAWARGRRVAAPLLFALAASVKLYPLIFLLYYLFARRWKEAGVFTLAVGVFAAAVAALWGGGLWASYVTKAIPPYLLLPHGFDMNVSWEGFFLRTAGGVFSPGAPALAAAAKISSALILASGLIWAASRRNDGVWTPAVLITLGLLVNSWTLHHYLVVLIVPFYYACRLAWEKGRGYLLITAVAFLLVSWRFEYWRYTNFPLNLLQSTKTFGMFALLLTLALLNPGKAAAAAAATTLPRGNDGQTD